MDTDDISRKLAVWIKNKSYTKCGITINDLSNEINTNRTYISNYINTYEKVNFNRWLNTLRIDEAKRILTDQPEVSLNDLALTLGYTDQSCLSRQFRSIIGQSPTDWKKQYLLPA